MSFQAKIAGQWPTLFYYLYETNIQTDGERETVRKTEIQTH